MSLEVHLLPILIWSVVGDIAISTVLWENTRPVITFSVAGKGSEMRLLASLAAIHFLLSVFPVKSPVSCRYLSRMWFSKRVTKSLLSSKSHNLSLSKICKCFFLLDGWGQNINASVWVTLFQHWRPWWQSITSASVKQDYWGDVLQNKQYWSRLG